MTEIMTILLESTRKQGLSLLLSLGFAFLFFHQLGEVRKEQRDCLNEYMEFVRQDHLLIIKVIENNTMVMESLRVGDGK